MANPKTTPRIIQLDPAWKQVGYFQDLVEYPPDGYEFAYPARNIPMDRVLSTLSQSDLAYQVQKLMGHRIPLQLLVSRARGLIRSKNLVFADTHIHLGGPYVLNMGNELPEILSFGWENFARFRAYIKKQLLADDCKQVICWVEAGKKAFVSKFGKEVESKVSTVYWGKPAKKFERDYDHKRIKLLFVNSANINSPSHFYGKGGKLVAEAFVKLRRKYPNAELTIRSSLPKELELQYSRIQGVRILNKPVSSEVLEREWTTSDIFVLPNHINTPANVFLDAMSFGLPVVTTDIWANHEIVEDGFTGLLVKHPDSHVFLKDYLFVPSRQFNKIILSSNPKLVEDLVDSLSVLIEDEELRYKMGKRAWEQVSRGKFSTEQRNIRLKKVLDKVYV